MKADPRLRFAGQITGVEGYVESAAIGLIAGLFAACERLDRELPIPPRTSALGSLLAHITGEAEVETFQPMNINFGLLPPPEQNFVITENCKKKKLKGIERKKVMSGRALADLDAWLPSSGLAQTLPLAAE